MTSYFRFLSRNKVYTLINVVGLSVSLAFVIIIGLYSQMSLMLDEVRKLPCVEEAALGLGNPLHAGSNDGKALSRARHQLLLDDALSGRQV